MLEDRVNPGGATPSVYTVELVSGPLGVHGSSAASVVGGGLVINPTYEQPGAEEPLAWVSAASETEAIKLGVTGSAVVNLPLGGNPTATYQFLAANVGSGSPAPYRVVADSGNQSGAQVTNWVIQLEDLAAHTGCDWDYDDTIWAVRVTNYSLPQPVGAGAIAGTVWLDLTRDNQLNLANDAPKANALVTLTTSTGGRFAETYTDANGFYAFTSLPLGNYRIRVSSWGLEKFVTQAYGGNVYIDSDVNASGNSNLIPVSAPGSAQFPSADVDAGVYEPTPSALGWNLPERKVVIKTPTSDSADHLKVAKWSGGQHDWSRAFEALVAQFPPENAAEVRLVEKGGFDFIDADPDRFNVFVKDTELAANVNTVTAFVLTRNAAKPEYDDTTTIRLVRYTTNQNSPWWGYFWSDSQILVSNERDDKYDRLVDPIPGDPNKTAGGIGEDNESPSLTAVNQKLGYSFPVGDRTHRAALGSTVTAEYYVSLLDPPYTATATVPIRKTVHLTIYRFTQAGLNGGNPVDVIQGKDTIDANVKAMQEIYAQVGVAVVPDIKAAVNVPANVDLTDGLASGIGGEEAALLGLGRTGAVNGKDDVEVYYVNFFTAPAERLRGYAIAKSDRPAPDINFVMISARERNWGTLAHEVGHVLDDMAYPHHHYPYDWAEKLPTDRVNLMTEGERAVRNTPPAINDSRRLTERQEERWDIASDDLLW